MNRLLKLQLADYAETAVELISYVHGNLWHGNVFLSLHKYGDW